MAGRYRSDLNWSDVTPKAEWLNRRQIMTGAAALGLGSIAAPALARFDLVSSAFSTDEEPTSFEDITSYNNFYEFGTGKSDPARNLRFRRDRQRPDSRGADLPVPLCRGMVVGRALGRVRAEGPSRPGGRAALGEIRGLRDRRAGRGDGRGAARGDGFPVRRGAEARRGDAPADHCRRRGLRRADAETEGRADAPRGAVEIRLQVDQVGRPDQPRRRRAAGELEPAHSARIRLLFQREPRARSSALEPEDRTADRRRPVRAADSDAEVQRLRRRGRVALRRHGPRERG